MKLKNKIFVHAFHYSMTFYRFFKVISETEKTFVIQELDKLISPNSLPFRPIVKPDENYFRKNSKPIRVRKSNLDNHASFWFKNDYYSPYVQGLTLEENHLD